MSLTLKSYFADSVEAAMLVAREELGDEAMLVESKRSSAAARGMGTYEVVFALAPAGPPTPRAATQPSRDTGLEIVLAELAAARRDIDHLTSQVMCPTALLPPEVLEQPELCRTLAELVRQDVSPVLVREIAAVVRSRLSNEGGRDGFISGIRARRAVAQQLEAMIRVQPVNFAPTDASGETGRRRILALVGPPGSGKTSSLVKLSALAAVRERRPTLVISADVDRVAAAEQLRCYASILGVAFDTVDSAGGLKRAIDEHRSKDVIFLDTPGIGPADTAQARSLGVLLEAVPGIEVQLVLPATLKPADMAAVVNRFLPFHPARFLFTHLDETATFGALLNECVRTRLPVSHLSSGQQIPEDLEAATTARLIDLVLSAKPGAQTAAA